MAKTSKIISLAIIVTFSSACESRLGVEGTHKQTTSSKGAEPTPISEPLNQERPTPTRNKTDKPSTIKDSLLPESNKVPPEPKYNISSSLGKSIQSSFNSQENLFLLSGIEAGSSSFISFHKDDETMLFESCEGAEGNIELAENGEVIISILPSNTAKDYVFSCSNAETTVQIQFLAPPKDTMSIATSVAPSRREPVAISQDKTWTLWEYYALADSGATQIVAVNNITGESIVASSKDGTWATAGSAHSSSAGISYDGRFVVFCTESFEFEGESQLKYKDLTQPNIPPKPIATVDGTVATEARETGCTKYSFNGVNQVIAIVVGDPNFPSTPTWDQIYLKDLSDPSSAPVLISTSDGTTPSNHDSSRPYFSGDGNYLAFTSRASNLNGCCSSQRNIYLKDINNLSSPPMLISSPDGTTLADQDSYNSAVNYDGSIVVFEATAPNINGDSSYMSRLYMKNTANLSAAPILVSSPDGSTIPDGSSYTPIFLGSSNKVSFQSFATNLIDTPTSGGQLFAKDLTNLSDQPILISSPNGAISGDGSSSCSPTKELMSKFNDRVYFSSYSTNLGADPIDDKTLIFSKKL